MKYEVLSTDKVKEYDVLRALVMVLVVLGHCTYYEIATDFGGMYYASQMQSLGIPDTLAHRLLSVVTTAIYSFHMPLFMALSGAVFAMQLNKGKYGELKIFVSKKAKRLLYPFLLVSVFWSFPLKYLSGYWEASGNVLYDVVVGQLLIQGNTHLWFLPTLFFEFILFWLCFRYNKLRYRKYIIISVLLLLHFASLKIGVKIINYTLCFAIYFYIGYLFEEKRLTINTWLTYGRTALLCGVWASLLVISHYCVGGDVLSKFIHHIFLLLTAVSGMLGFYAVCYYVMCRNIARDFIEWLAQKSMGIYLYSDSVNYLFMSVYVGIWGMSCLGDEWHASMIYLLRFLFTSAIAIILINAIGLVKIYKKLP